MPTNKPRVTITMSTEQFDEIDEFRFSNKIKNQTQAILTLIEKGLSKMESSTSDHVNLTVHETEIITAYRDQPEMQPAVDKLLGISKKQLQMQTQPALEKSLPNDSPYLQLTPEERAKADEELRKLLSNNRKQNKIPHAAFGGHGVEFTELTDEEIEKSNAIAKKLGISK